MSFHGAVGMVTGSCHMIKVGGLKILIDCGLFQGEKRWRSLNYENFGFNPADIDYVLLTHAHLDHCGRLPILRKKGFRGKIICTSATNDIAKVSLMDSARIQEEDYEHWRRINLRDGMLPKQPLYTTMDAMETMGQFRPKAVYDKPFDLGKHLKVTYRDAGHILGASFIEIVVKNQIKIVYSGDLGNSGKPIIRDPSFTKDADVVVLETTYGDRDHKDIASSKTELLRVVKETFNKGGNVLIPSFAIERAQELLFVLRQLHEDGELPECNVYLDSPMGISITNIMRRHPECLDEQTLEMFHDKRDPFEFPGMQFTKTRASSKRLNTLKKNAIIIAGAGMCNGGRIRMHFKYNIWRPECSIVFMGYQAEATLGRQLVDGEKHVSFLGEAYNVNAQVHTIGGFSSHADRTGLLDWLEHTRGMEHLFLLHGEGRATNAFKQQVEQMELARNIHIPQLNEKFTIKT